MLEMYYADVSMRRVEDITEALWGTRVSPSTVSELNQKIAGQIEAWRNASPTRLSRCAVERPCQDSPFPNELRGHHLNFMHLPITSPFIFVGTCTPKDGAARGIYAMRLDSGTGQLDKPELAAATPNPTFLALHPNGRVLYAVSEAGTVNGKPGGAARAFRLDTGAALIPLNLEATGGPGVTHLVPDATSRMLVSVSYSGGQVISFPLAVDGRIGPCASLLALAGALGPMTKRQDRPHPHSVTLSPDNRFAYVCDLALDKVFAYRLDPAAVSLTPAGESATEPGAGPRHSKISDDGRFLYVINELNSTISVYARDPARGMLMPVQTVPTLPADFARANICAEIRIHPNGRFVYGSNRGHDSIAVYARDSARGTLAFLESISSGGKHPRNFALSPDGAWLVCANRDSDNLVVFRVDPATGCLTPTGHTAAVPQAVCVLFATGG